MKKGLLIIMSGPSGVGKGTIRRLVMADKSLDLVYSISMTTRKKREFEREGVDYFYVTQQEFDKAVENDEFLEHQIFVNNSYGTPKAYVEKLRNEGHNVLIEINTNGAISVLDKTDGPDVISFFVVPPSLEELERRIRLRGTETEQIIQERLSRASKEIEMAKRYDYVVLNDNAQSCADDIRTLINKSVNNGGKNPDHQKGEKIGF